MSAPEPVEEKEASPQIREVQPDEAVVSAAVTKLKPDEQRFLEIGLGHFTTTTKSPENIELSKELCDKVIATLQSKGLSADVSEATLRQIVRNNARPLTAKNWTKLKFLLKTLPADSDDFKKATIIDTVHVHLKQSAEKRPKAPKQKVAVAKEPTPTEIWKQHKKATNELKKNPYYETIDQPHKLEINDIVQHFTTKTDAMPETQSVNEAQQEEVVKSEPILEPVPNDATISFKNLYQKLVDASRDYEDKPPPEQPMYQPAPYYPYPYAPPPPQAPLPYAYGYPYPYYPQHTRRSRQYYEQDVYDADDESEDEEEEVAYVNQRKKRRVRIKTPPEEEEEEDVVERKKPQAEPVAEPVRPKEQDTRKEYMLQMASQFLGNGRVIT